MRVPAASDAPEKNTTFGLEMDLPWLHVFVGQFILGEAGVCFVLSLYQNRNVAAPAAVLIKNVFPWQSTQWAFITVVISVSWLTAACTAVLLPSTLVCHFSVVIFIGCSEVASYARRWCTNSEVWNQPNPVARPQVYQMPFCIARLLQQIRSC